MKKGKDGEKMMGPLFPRLHVNDTERGGPRAPPRNKMALYEQLSIPSHGFNNYGALPHNPNKASSLVPAASSSQDSGNERNSHFPLHRHPSTHSCPGDNLQFRQSNGGNSNATSVQIEQRKVGDEDDFRVPVYVHSGTSQCLCIDSENSTTFGQNNSGVFTKLQYTGDKDQNDNSHRISSSCPDSRKHSEENLEACVSSRNQLARSSMTMSTKKKMARFDNASQNRQEPDCPISGFSSLCENDVCLQQEASAIFQRNDSGHGEGVPDLTRGIEKGNVPQPVSDSDSREDPNGSNQPEIDSEHHRDKTGRSVQFGNSDKSDNVSETSMVDSESVLDISPDDVIGIIGQKRFLKARMAIANQQRLFAVQVFELHRLIKVQRLIAASPHLLFEESTYLGKPSMKVSPAKKLPVEYVSATPVHAAKCRDENEQQNRKMECSAENAVGKIYVSSVTNGSQPSNCHPYAGNPMPVPVGANAKMAPWCFHNSFGHQWLVPVMTPSEGLVYKPYTAPGYMGSVCGGCQPLGITPLTGNFVDPAYGVPASHHMHQATMPIPGVPPLGHGYFPPYSMPIMNPAMSVSVVEQMRYFSGSGSHGQPGQFSGGVAEFNSQNQSPCNVQIEKNGSIQRVTMLQASKGSEIQGSTASSPSEGVPGVGAAQAIETRDSSLPLPRSSANPPEAAPQPQETNQPRQVIKVVPHNRRSATESAARIFQSIQEERKQHDSI